jgi:hypothetical protein
MCVDVRRWRHKNGFVPLRPRVFPAGASRVRRSTPTATAADSRQPSAATFTPERHLGASRVGSLLERCLTRGTGPRHSRSSSKQAPDARSCLWRRAGLPASGEGPALRGARRRGSAVAVESRRVQVCAAVFLLAVGSAAGTGVSRPPLTAPNKKPSSHGGGVVWPWSPEATCRVDSAVGRCPTRLQCPGWRPRARAKECTDACHRGSQHHRPGGVSGPRLDRRSRRSRQA